MASIDAYIDGLISRGRACFSRAEAEAALGSSSGALSAALARAIRRRRLARLRRDFFLVVRPEHWNVGGPDPVEWIDPLMRHQRIDYRVSLLRAAAFHGSSHQASMVFQVVVPHFEGSSSGGTACSSCSSPRRHSRKPTGPSGLAASSPTPDSPGWRVSS
jgi:hypothetical protein